MVYFGEILSRFSIVRKEDTYEKDDFHVPRTHPVRAFPCRKHDECVGSTQRSQKTRAIPNQRWRGYLKNPVAQRPWQEPRSVFQHSIKISELAECSHDCQLLRDDTSTFVHRTYVGKLTLPLPDYFSLEEGDYQIAVKEQFFTFREMETEDEHFGASAPDFDPTKYQLTLDTENRQLVLTFTDPEYLDQRPIYVAFTGKVTHYSDQIYSGTGYFHRYVSGTNAPDGYNAIGQTHKTVARDLGIHYVDTNGNTISLS